MRVLGGGAEGAEDWGLDTHLLLLHGRGGSAWVESCVVAHPRLVTRRPVQIG